MMRAGNSLRIVTPLLVALPLAAIALIAPPAKADLIGAQMTAGYFYPTTGTPYALASFTPPSFTVGAGEETVGNVEGVTFLHVDFSADALTIVLNTSLSNPTWNGAAFNGIIFTASNPLGISSLSVDPSTTMSGFSGSRASLSGNDILIDWNGLSYVDGTVVTVDFAFNPSSVPEPASLPVLAAAIAGIAALRWRFSPTFPAVPAFRTAGLFKRRQQRPEVGRSRRASAEQRVIDE